MMSDRTIQIRVPSGLADELKQAVKPTVQRESIAFALVSHTKTTRGTIALVRKVISLPADGYVPTSSHGAKWRGAAMLPILNQAVAENLGIILFHVHQLRGHVELSSDDRQSAEQ